MSRTAQYSFLILCYLAIIWLRMFLMFRFSCIVRFPKSVGLPIYQKSAGCAKVHWLESFVLRRQKVTSGILKPGEGATLKEPPVRSIWSLFGYFKQDLWNVLVFMQITLGTMRRESLNIRYELWRKKWVGVANLKMSLDIIRKWDSKCMRERAGW